MKKVLVLNYSQTGQLDEILDNFLATFNGCSIERVKIQLKNEFPFPWDNDVFFNEMPETVLEEELEILPIEVEHDNYDLIVIGHAPWFLSPSRPTVSLLKDKRIKSLLKDTAIVTVIGSRNMWLHAQESVKKYIAEAGGHLVGNVVLYDRVTNLVSAFTILYWMQSGKKDRLYNIFPKPGISDEDIKGSGRFGKIVSDALAENSFIGLQEKLLDLGLIKISTNIMFVELRAKVLFKMWAKKIKSKSGDAKVRLRWVRLFKYYLLIALFVISPILLLLYNLFGVPFTLKNIKSKKAYFYDLKLRD